MRSAGEAAAPRGGKESQSGKMTSEAVAQVPLAAAPGPAALRPAAEPAHPAEAAEGTIRKLYAKSVGENSVHGSDAAATAAEEIPQFFSEDDIVG